jgi:hypothetical protein
MISCFLHRKQQNPRRRCPEDIALNGKLNAGKPGVHILSRYEEKSSSLFMLKKNNDEISLRNVLSS